MNMSDKEDFQRFSISLPKDLFNEFEEFRKRHNISRSDAIRKSMREYVLKETKNERVLSREYASAVITLYIEHVYHGHSHDHDQISTDEHVKEHTHDSHDELDEILNSNYFTYPDTDLIKINHMEHVYHDIVLTKLHIHVEHDKCMLLIPVRGPGKRIQEFYEHLIMLKSVLSHNIIVEE